MAGFTHSLNIYLKSSVRSLRHDSDMWKSNEAEEEEDREEEEGWREANKGILWILYFDDYRKTKISIL